MDEANTNQLLIHHVCSMVQDCYLQVSWFSNQVEIQDSLLGCQCIYNVQLRVCLVHITRQGCQNFFANLHKLYYSKTRWVTAAWQTAPLVRILNLLLQKIFYFTFAISVLRIRLLEVMVSSQLVCLYNSTTHDSVQSNLTPKAEANIQSNLERRERNELRLV